MEVFSMALQKRAVNIILVHNHPSGELKPSEADKDITDRLLQVGNIVKTYVLDHLIITEKTYMSFQDSGLLDELKKSKKWVPRYQEEERIRKEAEEIGESRGREIGQWTEKAEIARAMKRDKKPIAEIVLYTGLSVEEIGEL